MRAKLNSLLNYVDKGQNKGQLRDFLLFLKKNLVFNRKLCWFDLLKVLIFLRNPVKNHWSQKPRFELLFWFRDGFMLDTPFNSVLSRY